MKHESGSSNAQRNGFSQHNHPPIVIMFACLGWLYLRLRGKGSRERVEVPESRSIPGFIYVAIYSTHVPLIIAY